MKTIRTFFSSQAHLRLWVGNSHSRLLLLQPFPQNELHPIFLCRASWLSPASDQAHLSSRAPQSSTQLWLVWWSWSRAETTALFLSWGHTTTLGMWYTMTLVKSGKNDACKVSAPIRVLGTQDCGQVLASAKAFGAQTLHWWAHARQLVCWALFYLLV